MKKILYFIMMVLIVYGVFASTGQVGTMNVDNLYATNNVGIGTISPDQAFSYAGNIALFGQDVTAGTLSYIILGESTSADQALSISYDENNNRARFNIFGDSGSLGLNIADGGNVGISTSVPSAKLDVVGDTELNGDLNVDSGTLFVDSTNNYVGIGTTNPLQKLHINSGITNDNLLLESTDPGVNLLLIDNETTQDITLQRFGDNLGIVPDGGNVGIGTNSPDELLDVGGIATFTDSNVRRITITPDFQDARYKSYIGFNDYWSGSSYSSDSTTYTGWLMEVANDNTVDSASWINFKLRSANDLPGADNYTSKFYIGGDGNVGIGTDSPSAKFDVVGDTELNGNLTVDSGTLFVDSTNNYVGVGTTSPLETVDINGDGLKVSASSTTSGKFYLYRNDGTIGAGDSLGSIFAGGRDEGSGYPDNNDLSEINFLTGGTWNTTSMPTQIDFYVTDVNEISSSRAMRINPNGAVSIGTTDTDNIFEVRTTEDLNLTEKNWVAEFTGYSSSGLNKYTGSIGLGYTNGLVGIAGKQTTGDTQQVGLAFFTHPSGSTEAPVEEAMVIKHDGTVGIGTDSPDEKLHIGNGAIKVGYTTDTFDQLIEFVRNDVTIGAIDNSGSNLRIKALSNNDIDIIDDSNNGITVKDGGNVEMSHNVTVGDCIIFSDGSKIGPC